MIPSEVIENCLSALRGKTVFVTGGTGFFGVSLLGFLKPYLDGNNVRLILLSRDPERFRSQYPTLDHSRVSFLKGDVRTFKADGLRADAVFHFATPAIYQGGAAEEIRHVIDQGMDRTLQATRDMGARDFLFASSGAVYRRNARTSGDREISENSALDLESGNSYALGKIEAEQKGLDFCRSEGIHFKLARCFAFAGPFLNPQAGYAFENFIRQAREERRISIQSDGQAVRSYLFSEDLIVWLLMLLDKGRPGEPYNVGSDRPVSVLDLAKMVAKFFGADVTVDVLNRIATDPASSYYVPSIEKAKKDLGVDVWTDLSSALSKTVNFRSP